MVKIIPFAIPVFIVLILLEVGVAWVQGRRDYLRLSDAMTALACGISSQVVQIFFFGITLVAYTGIHTLTAPLHAWLPWTGLGVFAWIFAILAYDHQYYWWHRHSHRVNVLWAVHVVHHHSQEYNLAVALRQAMFSNLTVLPYYIPLAILGVDPFVFAIVSVSNTLYQFWIHTRTVGRLGPLEWFLNTPSHHRVHHGINPEYIDKNHAGMLIVWDRMYGTFANEAQEPVYGTVAPLRSYDPIWANFASFADLARVAWSTPRWTDKLRVWFMPPEWSPAGPKHIPQVDRRTFARWDVPMARGLTPYLVVHFGLAVLGTVWILWMKGEIHAGWLALLAIAILWCIWNVSQLLHRRSVGLVSELLRVLALPGILALLLTGTSALWPAVLTGGALSIASVVVLLLFRLPWTDRSDLDPDTGLRSLPPSGPRGRTVQAPSAVPAPGK